MRRTLVALADYLRWSEPFDYGEDDDEEHSVAGSSGDARPAESADGTLVVR